MITTITKQPHPVLAIPSTPVQYLPTEKLAFSGKDSLSKRLKSEKQALEAQKKAEKEALEAKRQEALIEPALRFLESDTQALTVFQLIQELKGTSRFSKTVKRLTRSHRVNPARILGHFPDEQRENIITALGNLCAKGVITYQITGYHRKIGEIATECCAITPYPDLKNEIITHLDKAREHWHTTGEIIPPSSKDRISYRVSKESLIDFIEAAIKDFSITPVGQVVLERIESGTETVEPTPGEKKSLD